MNKTLTEKIEEILNDSTDERIDGGFATGTALESLTLLFKDYAESLIPEEKELIYANGDLRELARYHERIGFNSCREEIKNNINKV
jgi:hypothetical protein